MRFTITSFLLFFSSLLYAQTPKIKFKQLIFATYEVNEMRKVPDVTVKDYFEINENGFLHYKGTYYNGVADTVYQLKQSTIDSLNMLFGDKQKPQAYMVSNKLQGHFAGPLDYVSINYKDGSQNEMVVVAPFMSDSFNRLFDYIVVLPSKANTQVKTIANSQLSAKILKCHRSSKHIPNIEEPPPSANR